MSEATGTTTSSKLVHNSTLLPEFATEAFATVTTIFRTTRKIAEGVERTVDGVDEIATLMLSQQKKRLVLEYAEK